MSYLLEQLNDESFQQLCQALIVSVYPDAQCLPVGQPDGGRDAFLQSNSNTVKEAVVFQVKFSKHPHLKNERDVVDELIRTELSKIDELKSRGISKYILLTNVAGTSHLGVGSIDRVNEVLSQRFNLPCFCWWRDDIERRIDANASIKWSYPDILRAVDLLQRFIQTGDNTRSSAIVNVLKLYMTYQLVRDAKLKFKQVELQSDIAKQFVDVPAYVTVPDVEKDRTVWAKKLQGTIASDIVGYHNLRHNLGGENSERFLTASPGALNLLLRIDIAKSFSQIVIEGAPGQGKSTVTQYLCQIHRQNLLERNVLEGDGDESFRAQEARFPFRVDLRDYASWILGRDPFSDDPEALLPSDTNPNLESYLVAQVKRYSGCEFTVEDLYHVLPEMQIIVVLDGFDEVAEVNTRNRIVDEIPQGSARLRQFAVSSQVIVTSRPAAFANSPGFPHSSWQHIQLLSLSREIIDRYTDKWLDGKDAEARERREVTDVLNEKLVQSHVRELARNPMQLAILLALIATQGTSLPDRRTTLYDDYIGIFFNREAEKSAIVRKFRNLIVRVHWQLAYQMQAEAESNSGSGRLTEANLKNVLKSHLDLKQGSPDIDVFFDGMRERVGALVSRVQGTFEFEVQPLREYFAAKFLYDTAPISKTGAEKRGALPDRFLAIAANAYWLNVTRFYAGCYNSGELASLVEGLEELNDNKDLKHLAHLKWLSVFLITDYVFDPQPRLGLKLVERVLSQPNLAILLSQKAGVGSIRDLTLPKEFGQSLLADKCKELLSRPLSRVSISAISRTLTNNADMSEVRDFWYELFKKDMSNVQIFIIGDALGIYSYLDAEKCACLLDQYGSEVIEYLLEDDRYDALALRSNSYETLLKKVLDGNSFFFGARRQFRKRPDLRTLGTLALVGTPYLLGILIGTNTGGTVNDLFQRYIMVFENEDNNHARDRALPDVGLVNDAVQSAFQELLSAELNDREKLAISLERASRSLNSISKENWLSCLISIYGTLLKVKGSERPCNMNDDAFTLQERIGYAGSGKASKAWWQRQVDNLQHASPFIVMLTLKCAVQWQPISHLWKCREAYSEKIDALDDAMWRKLFISSSINLEADTRDARRVIKLSPKSDEKISPRLSVMLFKVASRSSKDAVFSNFVQQYVGDDQLVNQVQMDWCWSKLSRGSGNWSDVLAAFRQGHRSGASESLVREFDLTNEMVVPRDVCEEVCAFAHEFPLSLVAIAEATISKDVGLRTIPVGGIAKTDDWAFE